MKKTLSVLVSCALVNLAAAQTTSPTTATTGSPAAPPYAVVSQDANSAVCQWQTFDPGPNGTVVTNTHRVVELSTGLNHLVGGKWMPSSENIVISADGDSAMATNGQHQLYFPGNIYSGVIKMVTPDGNVLQSQPIGLGYSDGNNSVLLAVVTNSTGAILPSGNQVIYTNAFAGLDADLVYTYTKAGMEQDVVLRQQPPDPMSLGLNSSSTRLQMLTEFASAPQPKVTAATVPTAAGNLEDDSISFGAMQMIRGQAFLLGTNTPSASVAKRWLTLNGRQFLIEEVPIVSIANAIDSLPPFMAQTGSAKPVVSKNLLLPPPRLVNTGPDKQPKLQIAQGAVSTRGLVLDYQTVTGSLTNYVFQGDTTYYVSGPVYLYGTNNFEGDAVLKYTNNNNAVLQFQAGSVINCQGAAYRPIVLTSMNDNTVGETLPWSTGNPSIGGYTALNFQTSTGQTLSHIRVAYAGTAVEFSGTTGAISDSQIVNCGSGLWLMNYSYSSLKNALFSKVGTDVQIYPSGTMQAYNVTFDRSDYLCNAFTNSYATFVNCIVANVGTTTTPGAYYTANNNGFYNSQSFGSPYVPTNSNPFQASGGGSYYLANSCVFTDAGTTNIDPVLLTNLQAKTTCPPIAYTNVAFTNSLTFNPQATRDTNALPDLGYHYDPLDYSFGGCIASNNLTFTLGTAVGWFRTTSGWGHAGYGIHMVTNVTVSFNGTATAPTYWVRLNTVQEQDLSAGYGPGGIDSWDNVNSPTLVGHFLKCSMVGYDGGSRFFSDDYGNIVARLTDCEFWSGCLGVYQDYMYYTNCLMWRVSTWLQNGSTNSSYTLRNCTFFGGSFSINRTPFMGGSHTPVSVRDCSFDGTSISTSDNWGTNTNYTDYDYNAYTNSTDPFSVGGSHDQIMTNGFNWQTSWFGNYYQPTNSPLIYRGDVLASQMGLYHFTIQTNQVPDGTNTVSIGYHYVATDAYGNPLDSNEDGIPDYLEDPDGDGIINNGEYSWNSGIELSGPSLSYTVGSSPKPVDSAATLVAPDCSNLVNGSLTISISTNWQPEDTLAINNLGTGAGQVGITNNVVTYGGTNIGTFSGGTGSNALVITFTNSAATVAVAQAVLQNVTYHYYPGTNESLASRIVQFVLSDCANHSNFPVSKTIYLGCPNSLNVMLVLDCSQSMNDRLGGSVTKLQAATNAAISFVGALNFLSDQIGLVTFSTSATVRSSLTNNGSVTNILGGLIASGTTATSNGIATAKLQFPTNGVGTNALPIMVLLTDGVPNDNNPDPKAAAITAANAAKQAGIRLVTIGLGTNGNQSEFDPLLLTNLASSPDDCHCISNTTSLQPVYAAIANSLCRQLQTNAAPTVSFVSPTNGQYFFVSPLNIQLSATASESGGIISSVQFFNGTNLIYNAASSSSNTWTLLWTGVTNGTYTLTAVATDGGGATATNSISITVNAMPMVYIASPTNVQSYTEIANVTLKAVAYDTNSGGSITGVGFYAAQTNLPYAVTVNNTTNFTLAWNNLSPGAYPVMAVATNNHGAISWSSLVVFEVTPTNAPPTVVITSPTNGQVFANGSDITITAVTTNGAGTITNVEFFSNGDDLGGNVSTNNPYSITTCCWKPGNYQLLAYAQDNLGGSAVSSPVNITVAQDQPTAQGFWDPKMAASSDSALNYWPYLIENGFDTYGLYYVAAASGPDGAFLATANGLSGDYGYPVMAFHYDQTNCYATAMGALDMVPLAIKVDGTNIYIGGMDTNNNAVVLRWDGSNWDQVGGILGTNGWVEALEVVGGVLYAGGNFTDQGVPELVEKYDPISNQWLSIGLTNYYYWEYQDDRGFPGVHALVSLDGQLIVGGTFYANSGTNYFVGLARLNGNTWEGFGDDLEQDYWNGTAPSVYALSACGTNLFVGGQFLLNGNTNYQGIAMWNASGWHIIDGAPHLGEASVNGTVYTIQTRGDDVFITGAFNSVGDGAVPAAQVAKATWSEADQTWKWSDLDKGIDYGLDHGGNVTCMALREGPTPGQYDVFVGGTMDLDESAGIIFTTGSAQIQSFGAGLWRVGYPTPPTAPVVTITSPLNGSSFNNDPSGSSPITIPLVATAVSSYTNINSLNFVIDGSPQQNATLSGDSYTYNWYNPLNGVHLIEAVAADKAGLVGQSATIAVTVHNPTNSITAVNDFYTIPAGSQFDFYVTTNDIPSTGLAISQVTHSSLNLGAVAIGNNGAFLIYTSTPNKYGTDIVTYWVTNNAGAVDSAAVTIKIVPPSQVVINSPNNGDRFSTPVSPLVINGTAYSGDNILNVTNVTLQIISPTNSQSISQSATNGAFSLNWTSSAVGFYELVAVETDSGGFSNASPPVTIVLTNSSESAHSVTAVISNLNSTSGSQTGLTAVADSVITNGLFDLKGTAADSVATNPVAYQILLYRPDQGIALTTGDPNEQALLYLSETPLANLTPGPLNRQGWHNGGDSNGDLGTLNLTGVPNGVYELILTVRGGTDETNVLVEFQLDSQLKIGQFSFSQQDLSLPVNGIPITITRTYNSMNLQSGDFGYGWTYTLGSMDVQLDEDRQDVAVGSGQTPWAGSSGAGPQNTVNVRTGGGRDITLTLPDARTVTFQFYYNGPYGEDGKYYAAWRAPVGVNYTLFDSDPVAQGPSFYDSQNRCWDNEEGFALDNFDFPQFILSNNVNGIAYKVTRGTANTVSYDPTGKGHFIYAQAYGSPKLTEIDEHSGDKIMISDASITHKDAGGNLTRSLYMARDAQGRITAVYDAIGGTNGLPVLQYIYDQDNGNLIQVLKLMDRNAGTYVTNKYDYNSPNFAHYITSIENGDGTQVAQNFYDNSGRLIEVDDADGNKTQFIHNTTNNTEVVIDRLGNSNSYVYDLNGNVTAQTNALGQVTVMAYDVYNNKTNEITYLNGQPYATNSYAYNSYNELLSSTDALSHTNGFTYDNFGNVLTSADALGHTTTNYYDNYGNLTNTTDALGNPTVNFYNPNGLLTGTLDPLGNVTTNYYDGYGNLIATATLAANVGAILSSNSFGYDQNGNRTGSTVWRQNNSGQWVGATTTIIYDAMNRVIQTINPDGGTNTVVYDFNGRQTATIDPLNHTNSYTYDALGRLIQTIYPDGTIETNDYDANGNRTLSADRLGRLTTYFYDALDRVTNTIYADNTTNTTVCDGVGRVAQTIDARGTITAFAYDAAGRRLAVTNALGITGLQAVSSYTYDPNGNQLTFTDANGHTTTNVYDALNRQIQVQYPDGTKTSTGYDADGRRVTQTNQDTIVTLFGYDGAGRLTSVTNNATGTPSQQMNTKYQYDQAGNETAQVDALNRTNTFTYDSMGRRIVHIMPGGQSEGLTYDFDGNLIYQTNFNSAVITNKYDSMNRLTNCSSVNGYQVRYTYTPTGQRQTMIDLSGTTTYAYDNRDRLQAKTNNYVGGPIISLNYRYDANESLTNLWSSTSGGVSNIYQYDALSRLTNVLANGSAAANYVYDFAGNLQAIRYANGVTNLYQYDSLNRLTSSVWKTNGIAIASFAYTLGLTGNRTNSVEYLSGMTNPWRTNQWRYDPLYRLTNETINVGAGTDTLGYGYDLAGNRTNRQSTISQLPATGSSYNTNDWLQTDTYDNNGNTTWTTNSGTGYGPYKYDALNRLTNYSNIYLTYDGDGVRVKKVVGSTTNYYLVDDRNPSGYTQVLEEWTSTGTPTPGKVYNYGLSLISQKQGSTIYYFVFDGHGSTRALYDGGGAFVNAFAYDAFGTLIVSNGTPQTAYLYCGQQWDSDLGLFYNRARYLNPNSGRFWTMDTFAGNNEDPLSLHKYLYGADNPVNIVDPSGHDGDVISLNVSMNLVAGLAAFTAASVYEAKTHAIGNLMVAAWTETTTDAGSAAAAAESALSVARTSTRQLIKEAEDILEKTSQALKKVKVVPVPRSVIPNVANHVAMAQASGQPGFPIPLVRVAPTVAVANRAAALAKTGGLPAGPGKSWDEYPFASSLQGGAAASVVPVPWLENSIQGGIIGACYTIEGITPGTPYVVVVTP